VISKIFTFFVGFFSIANFSIDPAMENTFRMTDILSLALAVLAMRRIVIGGVPKFAFIISFLVVTYLGAWLLIGLMVEDMSTVYAAGRFSASALATLYLLTLWGSDTDWIVPLLRGMAIGGVVVTVIALVQSIGTYPLFEIVKPSSAKLWWLSGELRATGIWEHPNGLTHSTMIGAAAALGLCVIRKNSLLGIGIFAFITIGLYSSTFTRGGILIALVLIVVAFVTERKVAVRVGWSVAAVTSLVTAPFYFPDLLTKYGVSRSGSQSLFENATERIITGLETLWFSLQSPLGYGFNGRLEILTQKFGFAASHNSFLSIAMTFGLPVVIFLVLGYTVAIRKLWQHQGKEVALLFPVISSLLSCFLEDVIYSATFIMVLPMTLMAVCCSNYRRVHS
jgi:hypothetical protein